MADDEWVDDVVVMHNITIYTHVKCRRRRNLTDRCEPCATVQRIVIITHHIPRINYLGYRSLMCVRAKAFRFARVLMPSDNIYNGVYIIIYYHITSRVKIIQGGITHRGRRNILFQTSFQLIRYNIHDTKLDMNLNFIPRYYCVSTYY